MARPIDADALQELCNRRIQDTWNSGVAPVSWAEAYADFKDDIDSMPTLTPPNEWVSVAERLPRVGGNYICAVQDKNGGTWTIPAEWNLEMKTWFGAFGEIKNKVTHWMPLPEPPKSRPPEGELNG